MKSPLDIVRSFLRATQPLAHGEIGRPRVRVIEALGYILVFTLMVLMVAGFLYWHIASSYQQEMISWRARQSSMASDRAERVSDWLRERQRDAQLVAARPLVRSTLLAHDEARELPENPTASPLGSLPILEQVSNWYSYAGVYVLDPDGQVIRQSNRSIPFNPLFAEICRATARSGDMRIDLVGDAPTRSMIGFTAPVFTGAVATDEILPDAQHLGTVLIVVDASQTLFPLVTRDVIPTRTGETLLVRREGNDIVFFSPLRFVRAGSPNLRFPLSTAPIAARFALEGRETFAEYRGYRGAPVLAATQQIPLTGWGLVRKIDRVEALEDFRRQTIAEGVAACFLITLLAGLLLFHRRHVLTRVLKQKEEKFVALLESAPDAIYIIAPSSLRILGRNRKAMEMDGYSDEEIFRMTATDLHPPEDHPLLREWFKRQSEGGGVLHLHSLQGKGGQLVPVEERQTLVEAGGERLVLSIVRDITERKRAEAALRESEEHFRSLFENMLNGFAYCKMHYEQNQPQDFTYLNVNHAFESLTGLKNAVGRRVSEVIPGIREADPELFEAFGRVALTGTPERIEIYVAALRMWFAFAVYSPEKEYFVTVFDVITERKRAEQELLRVNRALRTISDCNEVLVRATEERQLLEEVCGILVLEGGYRMAWVGYGEHDEAKSIRPVAHAGFEEGYLQSACSTWADSERGRGPAGTAIRTGKPVIVRDIRTDPNLISWREEALKRGYASSIALPINLEDHVLGALTLYAVEVDAFDLAEVELLTELSDDLAYGIQALRTRAERQRVEEAHDYLASIVESSDDAIIGKSLDGVVQSWNKGAERLYGYTASEMIGQPLSLLVPADRHGELADFLLRINRGEVIEHYETVRVKKGGGGIDVSVTISPVKNALGAVVGASTIARDITDRKRAEEALIEERHLLHTLMDNLPDKIYFKDRESRFTQINLALAKELKLSHPAQAVGKTDFDTFPGEQGKEFYRDEQEIIMTGQPLVDKEEKLIWANGKVTWVSTTKMPLRDPNGDIVGTFGVSRDITERKRAEAEHIRLVTAIEQSAEAVVITNTAGDIEYVNPAFTHITGYGREEVLGQSPRILKSGKHDLEFYRQLWETVLKGEIWHGEVINRRKDGKQYTEEMTITPVRGASGEVTHFIATKQDVTERRTLEAQLHQASKMEAVGRLAGGVAHDFNNLLTIINGYSQILQEKLQSDTEATGHLKEISLAGERAAALTRQLLAFSRRQVLAPQVLDLNAVVSNLDKMLGRLIGEDIKLHTHLDPALGHVKADPGQIEQVLMNLVVNARDAMPTGGNLTLETGNVELDETYASTHPTVQPGPHVMLAVSDTGVGMTPETKARIFEPFFTTKEQSKGTGLGLATVYGIVKQSGGSIWVYSELGHGTVFKIYLPLVGDYPVAKELAKTETDSAAGTETILVVEDEKGVRSLIRLALISAGYKVLEVEDGESAVATCANYDGPIHMLLTDVVMPQMSGPAVAGKVATLRPGIKVVYMSGYTDDAMVHHGVLSQDTPFIQKPFSPMALRKKIREVLGERK